MDGVTGEGGGFALLVVRGNEWIAERGDKTAGIHYLTPGRVVREWRTPPAWTRRRSLPRADTVVKRSLHNSAGTPRPTGRLPRYQALLLHRSSSLDCAVIRRKPHGTRRANEALNPYDGVRQNLVRFILQIGLYCTIQASHVERGGAEKPLAECITLHNRIDLQSALTT